MTAPMTVGMTAPRLDQPESVRVELRCPQPVRTRSDECKPGHLLAMLVVSGEHPSYVQPDNLVEMACSSCRKSLERDEGRQVRRVLHRFNFAGELVETLVEE